MLETSSDRKEIVPKPSITSKEIAYVTDAVTHGWGRSCYSYIHRFTEMLKEYFGVSQAWPTSSCHGALHIALMALGVQAGDEVIVPDLTWVGSVVPISWLGARPVFVDSKEGSWCIDPEKIECAITPKTKAIVVVHLYGNLCEMDEIMATAAKYNLPVIEDAAEAVGSEYRGQKAGSIGDIGVFSMHGTKTLTSGEGGAVLTNREDLVDAISIIESQGRRPDKHVMFWVDDIGLKYKMSNMQAALGLAQFERASELIERKREIFFFYSDLLKKIDDCQVNIEQDYVKNSFWQPTIVLGQSWNMTLEKRNNLIDRLNAVGIPVRPFFYPVSSLPMYTNFKNEVAASIFYRGINLPSFFDLTELECRFIVENLKKELKCL